MDLINGDSLEVLKDFPENSIDSIVSDPPAWISFMGKDWDKSDGLKEFASICSEMLRVLKPGGHAFVWALPRTSHHTAMALEMAGFVVRDIVHHLFGSGFPKSLNIGKAFDKKAGAKREVVGKNPNFRPDSHIKGGRGFDKEFSDKPKLNEMFIEKPSTDLAKKWDGFGTGLKPATEHWILVRKPLSEKTIIANVEKHGVGGLNIDACRVNTKDKIGKRSVGGFSSKSDIFHNDEKYEIQNQDYDKTGGRFPANLIHDGSDVIEEKFLEQGGVRPTGDLTGQPRGENKIYGKAGKTKGTPRYFKGDTGSASRFFYSTKDQKHLRMNLWENENCLNVSSAEMNLKTMSQIEKTQLMYSALKVVTLFLDLALSDQNVLFAKSQLNSFVIKPAQSLVQILKDGEMEFIGEGKKPHSTSKLPPELLPNIITQLKSLVKFVEEQTEALIDITKIIPSLKTLTSYVVLATQKSTPALFTYQAKPSKRERNEGLEGLEEKEVKGGVSYLSDGISNLTGKPNKLIMNKNNHPTVKSIKLMSYLIKLITPPNGTVLDPFMGSGSTGVAAIKEGFDFIGIEREKKYFEIAKARIEHANE